MIKKLLRLIKGVYSAISRLSQQRNSWEIYRDYVRIHPTAIIDPSASIKIFNPPASPEILLEIGEGSHIFSSFSLLRPQAKIRIGKRCQLGNSHFICSESIEVGDDVIMAWGITVMDNDSHALHWEHRKNDVRKCYEDYLEDQDNFIKNKEWSNINMGPVVIENKSWIGFNAVILKGVVIGHNAVIGACSVVAKDVPPFSIVAGNPARIVKDIGAIQ